MLFYLPVKTPRGEAAGYLRAQNGMAVITLRRRFSGALCVLAGDRVLPVSAGVPFPFPADFVAAAGVSGGALAFYAADPAQHMTPARLLYALSRRAPLPAAAEEAAAVSPSPAAPEEAADLSRPEQGSASVPSAPGESVSAVEATARAPQPKKAPASAISEQTAPAPESDPVSVAAASKEGSAIFPQEPEAESAPAPSSEPAVSQANALRPVRVARRSRPSRDAEDPPPRPAAPDVWDTAAVTRSFAATLRHACRVYAEALEEEQQPFTPPVPALPGAFSVPPPAAPVNGAPANGIMADSGMTDGEPANGEMADSPAPAAGQDGTERPLPPWATRENRWMDEVNALLFSVGVPPRGR